MFRATRCTRRSEQRCLAKRIANEIQSAEQDVRAVAVAALVDKGLRAPPYYVQRRAVRR